MSDTSIKGSLLLAAPGMTDPNFRETVVLMCDHTAEAALGIVLNRPHEQASVGDILQALDIPPNPAVDDAPILWGGPCDPQIGMLVHTDDRRWDDGTQTIGPGFALTTTRAALDALGLEGGPRRWILALGYAGWGGGQLESELRRGDWLVCPVDEEAVFGPHRDGLWRTCLAAIGIDPARFSRHGGVA
jgi:putative transcriptional regulator